MKLLFIINQFYKGGAESSLLNLLKKLDSEKYDIDLLVLNQCPVKNGVSLIERVPACVNVFDAYKENRKFSLINKVKERILLTPVQKNENTVGSYLFVRNKTYDWAFHVGEWWTPDFLATEVNARHKAVWIHTDITRAVTFSEEKFFSFDDCIDKYIFVSKRSLESCMDEYPFLRDKSECIYNILDTKEIRELSGEEVEENYFDTELPVLVTCANVRKEKNHLRQLHAMSILKERGVDFVWVNIGSTSERDRCEGLIRRAKELGLSDRFILAGPRDNPYRYMKRASAVTVLSDYESWSMVITEAKILGVPVIATKTSGALEQIEHGRTGMLTDFSEADIADKIEEFLSSPELQKTIRENIKNSDNTDEILESFDKLVLTEDVTSHPKQLLYIIDDVNYGGGAHVATKLQIKELLREGVNISVFSAVTPNIKLRSELIGVKFLSWRDFPENQLYNRRFFDCMLDKSLTKEQKKFKRRLTRTAKRDPEYDVFGKMVLPEISKLFSEYKTVCVMSESSGFRAAVADSSAARKVQWIHTDYCEWKDKTEWTRTLTEHDGEIYSKFDCVVFLTEGIRDGFVALYPELRDKTAVNKNLMPVDTIVKKAKPIEKNGVRFVTVARVDKYKGIDRMCTALLRLYEEGYRFSWTVIGNGDMLAEYTRTVEKSALGGAVELVGARSNPFPYVKEADVFALPSRYEGIPNTIYEALILGTPVFATDVGGIGTQVTPGENGWLVENDDGAIYEGLKYILDNPHEIAEYKNNLKSYHYDNEAVMDVTRTILFN
ncbi:MAG: glycosyltransferase [Clostridia bacterium]|nr:glycosyltransferase [Clostridia bacterium]